MTKKQVLDQLTRELQDDRASGLWRSLDLPAADSLLLCTNDYLGLSRHPDVIAAATASTETHGTSARAARTLYGTTPCHLALEKSLADFKSTDACLLFPAGYMAAIAALRTFAAPEDVIILDRCCHACLFDGAQLSGAKLRVFRHNDPEDLDHILAHERQHGSPRALHIVTESLFSMEGDLAPLEEISRCARAHDAFLIVDEAHANGLYGPHGAGRVAELELGHEVDLQMGTLGKSLASSGGFIAGSQDRIDFLKQRASTFLFTTAAPPATAAAAAAALRLITGSAGDKLRAILHQHIAIARDIFPESLAVQSPVITLPVSEEATATRLQQILVEKGILISAARHPTVPRGAARLRISLTAAYPSDQIRQALTTIYQEWHRHAAAPHPATP